MFRWKIITVLLVGGMLAAASSAYTLTVNSGTGGGSYSQGTVVSIAANTAASGKFFDKWTGATATIANINAASTTITMPGADATITATYTWVASGLVTRYTFDIDGRDSIGSNNGTLNGALVANDATRGKVLSMDGTDDTVSLPTTGLTPGRSELTLSMWIKPDATTGTNTIYDAHYNWYWQFAIRQDGWYTRDSSTGTTGSRDNDLSMPSLTVGSWQHLAFVYSVSGTTKAIYRNGSPAGSTSTSVNALTSERSGEALSALSDGTYYDGLMDDVRLYSRALNTTEITYLAEQAYTLTVNSGTGGGTYAAGTVVSISANAPASGKAFDKWTGNTSYIANVNASSTTLTMPAAAQTITATYVNVYLLTVNSGTGGGSYKQGVVVNIVANAPASGKQFDKWTGNTSGIANVNASSTTLTMPTAAQTITATYVNVYVLTVNSGTGGGTYKQGVVVSIVANAPASGKQFDKWIGNTSGIANVNASSTTLTMPAAAQTITATYVNIYVLTVNSGSGDGTYTQGTVVNIAADAAPSGKVFDKWTGNTSGIANVNGASTTLTMPAAAQTVTATYKDTSTYYTLTVNGGTGGGSYTQGTVVSIAANAAASGQFFDRWTGNTSGIANINASSTTLTMPAANQTITSTYASVAGGLVSRFTFDIDARDSIGSNNGTLTGGALVANDATRGKVLSLDGTDDYVSLPTGGMAAGRSQLTLSMWVRPDTWVSGDTLYDEAADTNYWQFTLVYGGYYTRDSSTGTQGTRDNDVALPSLTTGSWQHLAVTYSVSGAKKQVYLNGVPGASSTTSIDALTSSRTGVGIGYASDGTTFDGLVDDVRLYNRALNTTEIAVLAGTTLYTLTVNSGTGGGSYAQGTVVNIVANAAPSGKVFSKWTGNTSGIANVNASSTTLTMPAANQTVTATYKDAATYYTLTVNTGTGDGSYIQGTVVSISANAPASGKTFSKWIGNTSGIANVNASSTTLTMPAANQTITATYVDAGGGPSISSTSGTWGHGNSITISGSGFGGKSQAAPLKYDDFEAGTLGVQVGNGWFTSSNLSDAWPIYANTYKRATGVAEKSAYCQHDRAYNSVLGLVGLNWGYGQEVYVSMWYYCTTAGAPSRNFKFIQFNSGSAGDWLPPEIRADQYPNGSNGHAYATDCAEVLIAQDWSLGGDLMTGAWHRVDMYVNTGQYGGAADGLCKGWRDLSQWWSFGNFDFDFSTANFNHIYFAGYFAQDTGSPTPQLWWYWDEIYVDTTQARVEVGNASTWSGCTQREIQIPSAWSGSSITITANKGSFGSFSGKYLYVVDSSGNINSNGYAIN